MNAEPISSTPIPNLYISDITVPNDPNILRTYQITHILSLTSARDLPDLSPELKIHHLHIPIEDNPYEDLVCLLEGICVWVEVALSKAAEDKSRVLVHCVQGQSRSAAIIVAYFMRALDLEYEAAMETVRSQRKSVMLNSGFVEQLKVWRDLRFSVFDKERLGKWELRKEYVEWKENRGILMTREQREREEVLKERMKEMAMGFGRRDMEAKKTVNE